ncbi:MAG: DUF1538 domain-containing protein [Myxococcota bacterium]
MISWGELLGVVGSTLRDVMPLAAVLIFFQLAILRRPLPNPRRLALGLVCVLGGLSLFLVGLEQAVFPIGKTMAAQFTAPEFLGVAHADPSDPLDPWAFGWLYAFSFAIGFGTTMAEPSLIAVARKARELTAGAISDWGLRVAVALGVAVGITLGVVRIVTGVPLPWIITGCYAVVVVQTFFAPKLIVPLAYDSGGVTTSTITVPLVAGLGLGLAESVPGRSPLIDGFGLIAFASVFPMITVMGYAQASEWIAARSAVPGSGSESEAGPDESDADASGEDPA